MILLLSLALIVGTKQQPSAPPVTQRDSTMRVTYDVGTAVANVRSSLERYRTLVFNDSNATGSLLQAGGALRDACEDLSRAATTGYHVMVVRSVIPDLRPAFGRYRDNLPSVSRLGERCAERLRPSILETARPAALRRLVLELSEQVRVGLAPYEQRVSAILQAMRAPGRRNTQRPSPGRKPN